MFGLFKKKPSLEVQLNKLAEMGISMREGLSKELLLEEFSKSEYEDDPYNLLLMVLGGEAEVEGEYTYLSKDIWYLDTECVEDHGDYARIIKRLEDMTSLGFDKITDYVDIQKGVAWVSFEYEREPMRWELKVDDDWLDLGLFEKINELLLSSRNKLYLTILDQSCLIGYLNKEQVNGLNKVTKYKFKEI